MAILIDLILISFILLSTFLGYKKGLIGVAFKILSFFIAIIITILLYKPVANYIINYTSIDDSIQNIIVEKLSSTKIEGGEVVKEESNLPEVVVDYINNGIEETVNQAKDNVVIIISKNLTENAIYIISMVAIFIITRIALLFGKFILEAVSELPIIKQFNEAGGILYGILRGILLIYIILTILSFILPMLNKTLILEYINQTFLTKFLYNYNLILMLFFK